jgi:hypothetical protein
VKELCLYPAVADREAPWSFPISHKRLRGVGRWWVLLERPAGARPSLHHWPQRKMLRMWNTAGSIRRRGRCSRPSVVMPQRRTSCVRQNIDAGAARVQNDPHAGPTRRKQCCKARSRVHSHVLERTSIKAGGPAAPLSGTRPPGTAFDQRQREGLSFASSRPSASCQNGQTGGRAFCPLGGGGSAQLPPVQPFEPRSIFKQWTD